MLQVEAHVYQVEEHHPEKVFGYVCRILTMVHYQSLEVLAFETLAVQIRAVLWEPSGVFEAFKVGQHISDWTCVRIGLHEDNHYLQDLTAFFR